MNHPFITTTEYHKIIERAMSGDIDLDYHILRLAVNQSPVDQCDAHASHVQPILRTRSMELCRYGQMATVGMLAVITGTLPLNHELAKIPILHKPSTRRQPHDVDITLYHLQQELGGVGADGWFHNLQCSISEERKYAIPDINVSDREFKNKIHPFDVKYRKMVPIKARVNGVRFTFTVSSLIPTTTIVNLIRTIFKDNPSNNNVTVSLERSTGSTQNRVFQYDLRKIIDRAVEISQVRDVEHVDLQIEGWVMNPALEETIVSVINEFRARTGTKTVPAC